MGIRPLPEGIGITQEYGTYPGGFNPSGGHTGRDWGAFSGTKLVAVADGVVRWADWSHKLPGGPLGWAARWFLDLSFGGIVVVIEHDDVYAIYAHLSDTRLNPGDRVRQGDLVGLSGNTGGASTGSHLHFEILPRNPWYGSSTYGRVHPAPYVTGKYRLNGASPTPVLPAPVPVVPRKPYRLEENKTSPNTSGRRPGKITGVTIHHWDDPAKNPQFDPVADWLCDPTSKVSAHFVVEDGRVSCLVTPGDVAWHAGNWQGNVETIGIECNPRMSQGDLETVAQLIADLERQHGPLLIYRHSDWTTTGCPGRYATKIGWLVNRVNALKATGTGAAVTTTATPPRTIDPLGGLLDMDMATFNRERKKAGTPAWYLTNDRDRGLNIEKRLTRVEAMVKAMPGSVQGYRNPKVSPKDDAYAWLQKAAQAAELAPRIDALEKKLDAVLAALTEGK